MTKQASQISIYVDSITREYASVVRELHSDASTIEETVTYFENTVRLCFENFRDEFLGVKGKKQRNTISTRFIKDFIDAQLGRSSFEEYCRQRGVSK